VDREAAARAIEQFLIALGHQPEGELARTPELVAQAWCEDLLEGQALNADAILKSGAIKSKSGGLVVLRGLAVTTMCPHHLLPAFGSAEVVYLPADTVAGFGSVARAMAAVSRKLTLQERAGNDMVKALMGALGARAAACRMRMTHTCVVGRGARATEAVVETLALAGTFEDGGADRDLLLATLR
jgi:GTP cyclohydrolase I